MPTERLRFGDPSRVPDSRKRERPLHYGAHFEIMLVPSTGKPGRFDVLLVQRTARGESFKQAHQIEKAWRGRARGAEMDAALAEAHRLREELDASLLQYRGR